MLLSLGLIFLVGMVLSKCAKRLKLPELVGMLVAGMLIGPYGLDILSAEVLHIAPGLREMALVIILIRAGLGLDLEALKKVGKPAIKMCFVPALCEIIGVMLLAPILFGVTYTEAAVMGTVLAAVSPAVIVPRMLRLIEEGYGVAKSIPQLVLAGASVDDIFVIVLFTACLGMAEGESVGVMTLLSIPIAIALGIGVGMGLGKLLSILFDKGVKETVQQTLVVLSAGFVLVGIEDKLEGIIPFSGLIGIMVLGMVLYQMRPVVATALSGKFSSLWSGAQIMLFVLVGASVDLTYALQATVPAVLLVCGALVFRVVGVWISLSGTTLTQKEKAFCVIAYMPKATVQAAIGGVPLAMGLACGSIVLTVAVIAIIVTAPIGAFCIDRFYKQLLSR